MGKIKEQTIKKRTAIIDGDMLVYRVAFSCEVETNWANDLFTLHSDLNEMKSETYRFLDNLKEKLDVENLVLIFSPSTNFRYKLMPSYKANRKSKRKPLGMKALKAWMQVQFESEVAEDMEADDLIGIKCTSNPHDYIAVSGDKDFATLPILWYNHLKGDTVYITPEQSRYNHLVQTIAGDVADGYQGIKGVGVKTAQKLLDKEGATWETVLKAYDKAGMTEEEAILNARMAYILQQHNYNAATKQIILWSPPYE